jgi:1-acyl-sn-glycerol-3-phosphate acyltransferase
MNSLLRWFFYAVFIRSIILIILGLNVRHREHLPRSGPAIWLPITIVISAPWC